MSPRTLDDPAATADQHPPNRPGPVESPRPRLTVREMQIALDAARYNDALEANSSVTPPIVASAPPVNRATTEAPTATPQTHLEPWLPEHDGPVSLAGVAAPRTRTVRRTGVRPDKAARRQAAKRQPTHPPKTVTMDSALAATAAAAPPRIVVVAACGGAGATTSAVLFAAGLAPASGAILLAGGPDRGALTVRSNADGGDVAALTAWASQHPRRPLQFDTPGMAIGTAGQDRLVVAASGRRPGENPLAAATATALLSSTAATRAAVVLDWCTPAPVPDSVWAAATRVVVVAPATSPGLLAAEYAVELLETTRPGRTPLSLLTVDVRGRSLRRAARAALARLRALRLPIAALPFDPALADDPRVYWPSLRRRTRSAVFATLTQLLQREDEK